MEQANIFAAKNLIKDGIELVDIARYLAMDIETLIKLKSGMKSSFLSEKE